MIYRYVQDIAAQRERVLQSAAAKPFIDDIIKAADAAMGEESIALKMSEYLLFYQTGNRKIFEKGYFDRRRKCFHIAAAYWLTEDEKYLVPLIDYIGYICDEFSWCVPAHARLGEQTAKDVVEHIDLFQSETARLFAEIKMCLEEKLPEYIRQRMQDEVVRRVLTPLLAGKSYNWQHSKSNWAAVCAGSVALAVEYFATEEQRRVIFPRVFPSADSYLLGIGEDGCCKEGLSYWTYGFSHFLILASIIKHYGGQDYFELPKVKKLALFAQHVRLSDSKVACISDGVENFSFRVGPMCYLKSIYPDLALPDLKYGSIRGNVDSLCELLWFDADYKKDPVPQETHYFEDTQWYVNKKATYSFVAKGGNNKEPHNHNDVGSFMITVGEETMISDLGCGEYVRETFLPETRYSFVQNCSRGHSVPIVGGGYQCAGKEYAAKNVQGGEDFFVLDIEGAYERGACERLRRQFTFEQDGIILTDTVTGGEIIERFISKICPKLCDGYVDLGCGRIVYDAAVFDVSVNVETFTSSNGVDIITVYEIDFVPKDEGCGEFVFRFEM